ncbi:MAG: DUF547 domain-containing protein [Planctomycetota bacterium]
MVNYRQPSASRGDRQVLARYLDSLSTASAKLPASRSADSAFWINAYNAMTVSGILKEHPTSPIRNHTAKLWGYKIGDDFRLYVGRTACSLNTMEHEILRKMSEPWIHFLIVCASIGCLRIFDEAYVAESVNEQLEIHAKHFDTTRPTRTEA